MFSTELVCNPHRLSLDRGGLPTITKKLNNVQTVQDMTAKLFVFSKNFSGKMFKELLKMIKLYWFFNPHEIVIITWGLKVPVFPRSGWF